MNEQVVVIPVWNTVSATWDKVNGAKGTIWAALGLTFAIMFGIGFVEGIFEEISPNTKGIIAFMGNIIGFLLQMGVLYIGIKRASNQPIEFRQIFRSLEPGIALRLIGIYLMQLLIFLPLIVLSVFLAAIIDGNLAIIPYTPVAILLCLAIPLMALFIFFVYIRVSLAYALVLDKGTNSWQAIKISWHVTRSNFWSLTGLFFIQVGLMIVGAIPFGIGLIWVLPYAFICYGLIYHTLLANNNQNI